MKCLVSKLKGVVNNSDLEKLGDIKFVLKAKTTQFGIQFGADQSTPVNIEIKGNGKFYTQQGVEIGKKIENHYFGFVYINNTSEGDCLVVNPRYRLRKIICSSASGNTFVAKEPNYTSLISLSQFDSYQAELPVNLNTICSGAKDIEYFRCVNNKYAEGVIETAVEQLISLGRNEGTFKINTYGTKHKVKFHNAVWNSGSIQAAGDMSITFGNNSATVTFNDSTIATYDGTTWTYTE